MGDLNQAVDESVDTAEADRATYEPTKRSLWRRLAAAVALVVGIYLLAGGLAQPIKAHVGHTLLERTFNDRLAAAPGDRGDPDQWRPWPWADLAPVGELHFPDLDERRIIADSANGEALAWAVGHVDGTAALGAPGVSAVAGHRDGRFELLDDVDEGDFVDLTTLDGSTIRYVVEERLVVDSRTVRLPIVHAGDQELILTTCWPIDAFVSGPERLLIRARQAA